ncbi:hypothetical protein JOC95_002660 [Bacillus tianshenii]|uniref:Uncharacterized protein n=1 Tax=Sutcliffiella tianshenii TaxID=1463404 RepID=A0ABS2P1L1_9BACI|nr:hypothetical protein [Bacillus tianshenii]
MINLIVVFDDVARKLFNFIDLVTCPERVLSLN